MVQTVDELFAFRIKKRKRLLTMHSATIASGMRKVTRCSRRPTTNRSGTLERTGKKRPESGMGTMSSRRDRQSVALCLIHSEEGWSRWNDDETTGREDSIRLAEDWFHRARGSRDLWEGYMENPTIGVKTGRRFDSLGGGYIPMKRQYFDSLGGGLIPLK